VSTSLRLRAALILLCLFGIFHRFVKVKLSVDDNSGMGKKDKKRKHVPERHKLPATIVRSLFVLILFLLATSDFKRWLILIFVAISVIIFFLVPAAERGVVLVQIWTITLDFLVSYPVIIAFYAITGLLVIFGLYIINTWFHIASVGFPEMERRLEVAKTEIEKLKEKNNES
jgi:hypothetical protein